MKSVQIVIAEIVPFLSILTSRGSILYWQSSLTRGGHTTDYLIFHARDILSDPLLAQKQ
jgi:hypothetical protein